MKWLIAKREERKTHRTVDALGGSTTRSSWQPFFASVTSINLRETLVSDDNLKAFDTLPSLTCLELGYTNVTDAGVQTLKRHPRLNYLFLWGTKISDGCLATLARMPLLMLNVESTQVSLEGCMLLSRELPECLICHSRENIIFREAVAPDAPYLKWLERDTA